MSKTDSNKLSISFGANSGQNEGFIENYEEVDEMDAMNEETFGSMDANWESEHDQMTAFVTTQDMFADDKHVINKSAVTRSNAKWNSFSDNLIDDDIHYAYDDIVVKSIKTLCLEDDEDFDDPAIMTFGRTAKPPMSEKSAETRRRLSSCSPPPPAILAYEEYSASPKTSTIWSTTALDTSFTPTISAVKMRTLEDIEHDLLNSNSYGSRELSSVNKVMTAEELETIQLNSSNDENRSDGIFGSIQTDKSEIGWSPFASKTMHNFTPNGRVNQELMPNIHNNNILTNIHSNANQLKPDDNVEAVIRMAAQQILTEEPKKEILDPLLKAKTLSEIENELLLVKKPEPIEKQIIIHPQINSLANNSSPLVQSPPKNFGHQFNQYRPQIIAQNRINNMFARPPVLHLMPGMHPAIGRALFAPALIPNSQRIFPFPLQSRHIMHPLLQQQQQQQLLHQHNQHFINRGSNYQRNARHPHYDDNEDEYSGLMTYREKEWLIKIQQMQTELKDPYVDDYYNVSYTSRKIAAKAANDKDSKTTPSLLLPERPKPVIETQTNNYTPVQFEGSLGKIQVSNVNCPRKLLDCGFSKTSNNNAIPESELKTITKSEVAKFRKLLLQIEKLYIVLLNIDDEDKRIGALPEDARKSHLETRQSLCQQLFRGLTNQSRDKINLEVVLIKKGLALLFRSLSYLSDQNQRAVIISDLLNSTNYRQYIIKPRDRLDYGQMLVNAILTIDNHEILLKIVSNINNISLIIKSEYGHRIISTLINQIEKSEMTDEIKSKWSIFVNYILDEVDDIPDLRKLCRDHLTRLGF